jgi:hypothetical protein
MDPFTRSAEPLARGGQNRYAPRAAEQGFDENRREVYDVLAIVEYDENPTILDCHGDLVDRILL